jgi:hypothetical protein
MRRFLDVKKLCGSSGDAMPFFITQSSLPGPTVAG